MKDGIIYEVIDAQDRRYIGQTTIELEKRGYASLMHHDGDMVYELDRVPVGGPCPTELLTLAEDYWIARRGCEGYDLLNRARPTTGGRLLGPDILVGIRRYLRHLPAAALP